MSKYEAVDRLMALASEKRADRVSPGAPTVNAGSENEPGATETTSAKSGDTPASGAEQSRPHNGEAPSAAARGRQMFDAIRPLLPAVAGAMRMVDHGAVQAIARLLPLLGGSPGAPASSAQRRPLSAEQEQWLGELPGLGAAHQLLRREVDALTLRAAAADDLIGRTRTYLERILAEQSLKDHELSDLTRRVRLLSAGVVILLMMIVAQIILTVVMLHR
jgi:hypothetical protein